MQKVGNNNNNKIIKFVLYSVNPQTICALNANNVPLKEIRITNKIE